jgi:hypothetical protein
MRSWPKATRMEKEIGFKCPFENRTNRTMTLIGQEG